MENYTVNDIEEESGSVIADETKFKINDNFSVTLPINQLEDIGHPLVPEVNDEYQMREIQGLFDLELISYPIQDPDYFTMLEGEAGVGKNMALKVIAQASNWPMIRVNFGVGTTYQSLVGRYAPVEDSDDDGIERVEAVKKTAQRIWSDSDIEMEKALELASLSLKEGSSFRWVDGLLTRAVKNGWMFVADEINAADEEALMPLNGLTENRDSRYLTIEEKSEVITPHENFRFIATRNPVTYAGVSEMNSALQSRAYVIEIPYHENEAIEEIVSKNSNIIENEGKNALKQLVNLAESIRIQEKSGNQIMTKISTRDIIKVARLTDIMDIRQAVKTIFLGVADPTDKESIKEEINTQNF